MVSQFDNSLIIEGKVNAVRSNGGDGGGASHQVTDISGNASFLGSEAGQNLKGKAKEIAEESQNTTQAMDMSRNNAQQVSQTT